MRLWILVLMGFLSWHLELWGQNSLVMYPLIDSSKNVFCNTGKVPEWDTIAKTLWKLRFTKQGTVTILHIGDSHIQGGYFPNRFRELMQSEFGVSGRGWIFPYSLAKSNGPEDIRFRSKQRWQGTKYNHMPAGQKVSLAGYQLTCKDTSIRLSIKLKQGSDSLYPFNEVQIIHNNPKLRCVSCVEGNSNYAGNDLFVSILHLPYLTDSVSVQLSSDKDLSSLELFGCMVNSSHPGILYHSLGINGVSYDSYLRYINYQPMLKFLHPQLLVISLGTNDAFVTKVDSARFFNRVSDFIDSVRFVLPGVCILFTTPGDHLRNRKFINPNLALVKNVIIEVANQKHCLYWDFFSVMGGLGSSRLWLKKRLMFPDMMHLSLDGYRFQGELFFEAFKRAINQTGTYGDN